jgi:tRNA(Ile)-lysidine synthase
VLLRIIRTIDRYRMFAGARRVGVAVSGGADSVCLLHVLRELAPRYGLDLPVLHVDHGLRGAESRADAEFVRNLATELGLPFHLHELDLRGTSGNLEQAARDARLAFFEERIGTGAIDRIATGHTRSDQAETVLFRLLRGAGSAGVGGIRPVTSNGIVRPLIEIDRAQAREYLRDRGLPWREDSSNESLEFARNRIRHGLLPQLAAEWNPGIEEALAHTAGWALAEESWWDAEIDRLAAAHLIERKGAILTRAGALREMPAAPARRLVRRAIERVKGDLRGIGFGHVESVLALAGDPEGGEARIPGVIVCRSFDWVRFAIPVQRSNWCVTPLIPGCTPVPGGGTAVSLEIIDNSETSGASDYVYNIEMGCLDWKWFSGSPILRNWQPGDRYQPMGNPGEKKLKNLFQEARIPIWERADWPVLELGNRIVWSRRFGPAAWCAADIATPVILRVREVTN